MAGEWHPVQLGELVSVKHGWPFKSKFFSENMTGYPIVVNIGNFRYSGGLRFESTTVKEYQGDYPPEFELTSGDILMVMTCQTPGGEILGIPGRIPSNERTYLHNQRLGKIIVEHPDKVDKDFLYWLFHWSEFNRHLFVTASGSKILHTAPARIESFSFNLPPRDEQRAIARILGALDDKIELNRRMNETLEEMARAIFKSWFVDFDPVRAKAEGRDPGLPEHIADLFPDRFEDSELGEIPVGWQIAALGDHFDAVKGVSYKGSGLADVGVPLHNLNSIYEGGGYKYEGIKHYNGEYAERHIVASGDIIIANTEQGHDRLLIGYAAIVPGLFGDRGIFSHHIYRLRAKQDSALTASFLCRLLNSPVMHDIVSGYANGTTVNMLPIDGMQKPQIIVPPSELVTAFDGLAAQIEARREETVAESRTLADTRDALLPKLLSGEVQVREAEAFVEDAV